MDIRNWSLDQIMQLPDNCFGRRWPIFLTLQGAAASPRFALSPQGLPDRCVIWELEMAMAHTALITGELWLRLADAVPGNWAEFTAKDLLLPRPGTDGVVNESYYTASNVYIGYHSLRMPVESQGRRIILGINNGILVNVQLQVCVVVSAVPKGVPDCLLSV